MRTVTGFSTDGTICQVYASNDTGWNSVGSFVTYETYPSLPTKDEYQIPYTTAYRYVDRYRYGITFEFATEGDIGSSNAVQIIQQFINIVVLTGIVSSLITYIALWMWPQFDSAIYAEQMDSPISHDTRMMYWKKYLYAIGFSGFAEDGRLDYEAWKRFCVRHDRPEGDWQKCWDQACELDKGESTSEDLLAKFVSCRKTNCRYCRNDTITLIKITRAVRRDPHCTLGKFMRHIEAVTAERVFAEVKATDDDDTYDREDVERVLYSLTEGRAETESNTNRIGQQVNDGFGPAIKITIEDIKIFQRDLSKIHRHYNLPRDLMDATQMSPRPGQSPSVRLAFEKANAVAKTNDGTIQLGEVPMTAGDTTG